MMTSNISYLTAEQSQKIDDTLMSPEHGFSVDQLMENAGISVSHAAIDFMKERSITNNKVIVLCGPGNNGGDGLVAARHLCHFGCNVTVVYPKETNKDLFKGLLRQINDLEIPILKEVPESLYNTENDFGLIVDAVFGFSFSGDSLRSPFDVVIEAMKKSRVPVLAVDVPSGWHVEKGNINNLGSDNVDALISLTAPKLCAKDFRGVHYLGGRFVPPKLASTLGITLPNYKGIDTIVKL